MVERRTATRYLTSGTWAAAQPPKWQQQQHFNFNSCFFALLCFAACLELFFDIEVKSLRPAVFPYLFAICMKSMIKTDAHCVLMYEVLRVTFTSSKLPTHTRQQNRRTKQRCCTTSSQRICTVWLRFISNLVTRIRTPPICHGKSAHPRMATQTRNENSWSAPQARDANKQHEHASASRTCWLVSFKNTVIKYG